MQRYVCALALWFVALLSRDGLATRIALDDRVTVGGNHVANKVGTLETSMQRALPIMFKASSDPTLIEQYFGGILAAITTCYQRPMKETVQEFWHDPVETPGEWLDKFRPDFLPPPLINDISVDLLSPGSKQAVNDIKPHSVTAGQHPFSAWWRMGENTMKFLDPNGKNVDVTVYAGIVVPWILSAVARQVASMIGPGRKFPLPGLLQKIDIIDGQRMFVSQEYIGEAVPTIVSCSRGRFIARVQYEFKIPAIGHIIPEARQMRCEKHGPVDNLEDLERTCSGSAQKATFMEDIEWITSREAASLTKHKGKDVTPCLMCPTTGEAADWLVLKMIEKMDQDILSFRYLVSPTQMHIQNTDISKRRDQQYSILRTFDKIG